MESYYTIGEISKLYGIGRDSLMYYEKLGLLSPTRGENNYRIYQLSDIWKLNIIKELRSLGFSMEMIKQYIDGRSLETTTATLEQEITLIDERIQQLKLTKSELKKRLENIKNAISIKELSIPRIVRIEKRHALILHGKITRDEEVDFLVKRMQKDHGEFYILGNPKIGAIYDMDSIKNGIYNEYEAVFTIIPDQENGDITLNDGEYACVLYSGPYQKGKMYLQQLFEFIDKNNYTMQGPALEFYRIDIHETRLSEEFLTEIQIPVQKEKPKH